MRGENASIIIDIVMGELQKTEEFSSNLAKTAKQAIIKGINQATEYSRKAVSGAISKGAYKETPASAEAVRKMARNAATIYQKESSKIIEQYNLKHKRQGGFWNFMGSLAVNTGVLRFGSGYKGGNFFRDRYVETSRSMDRRGNIVESKYKNYGRVVGDVVSLFNFAAQGVRAFAQAIDYAREKIEKNVERGLSNVKEIISFLDSQGYTDNQISKMLPGLEYIDASFSRQGIDNAISTLMTQLSKPENIERLRKAGIQGKDVYTNMIAWMHAMQTGEKTFIDKNGRLATAKMTEDELRNFFTVSLGMDTGAYQKAAKNTIVANDGLPLLANAGERSVYTDSKAYYMGKDFTTQNYRAYQQSEIQNELQIIRAEYDKFLSQTKESLDTYSSLTRAGREETDRQLTLLENLVEILEADRKKSKVTDTLLNRISVGVTNIANFLSGGTTEGNTYK